MRKNTNNASQEDNETILPAEQDPPQFTDHTDTKINEIDWSFYLNLAIASENL